MLSIREPALFAPAHPSSEPGHRAIFHTTHPSQPPTPQPSPPLQARRAPRHPILSIGIPATVQSGSLWRDPYVEDKLAGNYRVGPDYNVGYSPQSAHPSEQGQAQHGFESSHHHSQQQHHHHRGSIQHGGPGDLHEQQPTTSPHHAIPPHHAAPHHQMMMDTSHLSGLPGARHMAPASSSHYGAPGSAHSVSMYQSMTPTQPQSAGMKRGRTDDLDLSGIHDLDQGQMTPMQQVTMGAAYGEAAGADTPTHHHHRLPDHGPPSKMMRRDGGDGGLGSSGGGAPSVVGQTGMPAPAPKPRGPKLKFTPEDDQLLIDLKENKSLTWKQIADFFPGRSSGTLQVRYCTKLKAKTTQWTDETDQKLRNALVDYENEKWRIIANKVGTGFTPIACRERAQELIEGIPPQDEGL